MAIADSKTPDMLRRPTSANGRIRVVGLAKCYGAFQVFRDINLAVGDREIAQNFDTPGVFASILIIGLIGVGLMRVGLYIEARFARWRH